MISMDKKYRTRDGREVRIYAVDGRRPSSVIHGAVNAGDGWVPISWYETGAYQTSESGADLIEVKPRIKRDVWVNVYPDYTGVPHDSKSEADSSAEGRNRIACVKVTIDCEEGEGL